MSSKKRAVRVALLPPTDVRRHYAAVLSTGQVLALDVLFGLRGAVQGVDNLLGRWLGPDALTPGRLQVLTVLWAAGRPVAQRDIVHALNVSRATVSDLIELLVSEGHARTEASSVDKRQVLVELTPRGRETTVRLVEANASRLREAFGTFSDQEMILFSSLLVRLSSTLAGHTGKPS